MSVEVGDVTADLEAIRDRQRARVDARTGHDDHPQGGHQLLAGPKLSIARLSRAAPTPEPPTVTTQTCSSDP